MNNKNEIIISETDYQNLLELLKDLRSEAAILLEEEIQRAKIVANEDLPSDVVAMNSELRFLDLDTQKESKLSLVYPEDADIEKGKISILSPIGSALIGLSAGQSISWPLPSKKLKNVKVVEVIKLATN